MMKTENVSEVRGPYVLRARGGGREEVQTD